MKGSGKYPVCARGSSAELCVGADGGERGGCGASGEPGEHSSDDGGGEAGGHFVGVWGGPEMSTKLALVAVIVAVIAGVGTLEQLLATAQDEEVQRLAQGAYINGLRGLRAVKLEAAVEAFRKAHAMERVIARRG